MTSIANPVFVLCSALLQASGPGLVLPPTLVGGGEPVVAWGAETNGVSAGVAVRPGPPCSATVVFRIAPKALAYGATNRTGRIAPHFTGTLFLPTNEVCGPFILRDASGKAVPWVTPSALLTNSYPPALSLTGVYDAFSGQYSIYSGPGFPPCSLGVGTNLTAPFVLTNYLRLARSGRYELKVWPKLYKRVFPKSDLTRRVDLPPVSVSFEWTKAKAKTH